MSTGRKALATIALLAAVGGGIGLGYTEGQRDPWAPASVRVVYEESGEVSYVETDSHARLAYSEHWRGNDSAPDGLYDTDPAADSAGDAVHVSIEYDEHGEAAAVTLTDAEGHAVPTGSVAESWTDDNTDEES